MVTKLANQRREWPSVIDIIKIVFLNSMKYFNFSELLIDIIIVEESLDI